MARLSPLLFLFLGLSTYKRFQSNASAEVKEYTLEEWSMQQNRVSGIQQQELPAEEVSQVSITQEEESNRGNRTKTNKNNTKSDEGSAQLTTGEEDSVADDQTKEVSTSEEENKRSGNDSQNTSNTNDKNRGERNSRNSNSQGKDTPQNANYIHIQDATNRNSDMSTSGQNEMKDRSNNQKEDTPEDLDYGSKMGTKYGELRNRGGRGGSDPCVEDITIRAVQIKSVLMQVSDRFDLENPDSPQFKAAAWIIYGDPMRLSADDPRLFQRYSAVVLYLATRGDKWFVCSANTTSPCGSNVGGDTNNTSLSYYYYYYDNPQNSATEVKPKRELNKIKAQDEERWLSDSSECEWYGLRCDSQGQITSINLNGNNLSGELPPEIKTFCYARDIKMAGNKICGRLPNTFNELKLLKNLRLGRNLLTGVIPSTFYQLVLLERLDVHANMLSGRLSTKMGNLKELRRLQLSQNLFTGTIPKQIGTLRNLRTLQLQFNQLTGTVPNRICALRHQYLDQLEADCASPPEPPLVECRKTCCTSCFSDNERPLPPSRSPTSLPTSAPSKEVNRPTKSPASFLKTFPPTSLSSENLMTQAPTETPVMKTSEPTAAPTPRGTSLCFRTPLDRAKDILNQLLNVTDLTTFKTSMPQKNALDFIINNDDSIPCPEDPNLVQRYVLSALYYATNGDSWLLCSNNTQSDCPPPSARWLSKESECSWFGSKCPKGDFINEIELENNDLSGSLISEIGSLKSLTRIVLGGNQLTGTIPIELGALSNLETLELQDNSLRGSVPERLCTLSNSPVVSVDCQEVVCQEGCCTCFPLVNKSALSDVANQDLTSGLVVLTNITRIIDDTSKQESDNSVGSVSLSNGDDGFAEFESTSSTTVDDDYYKGTKSTNESASNSFSNQSWQSSSKPSSNSTGYLQNVETESVSEVEGNKTFPMSDESVSESAEVLVESKSATDESPYYVDPNNVSKEIQVEKISNGAESAGVQADMLSAGENSPSVSAKASSPREKYLLVFISLSAVLIVLIGTMAIASFWRRNSTVVNSDANAYTEKSLPVAFDDSEAEEECNSSVASSCLPVKNESISSSDRSSKVKDADVVKWWLRARR